MKSSKKYQQDNGSLNGSDRCSFSLEGGSADVAERSTSVGGSSQVAFKHNKELMYGSETPSSTCFIPDDSRRKLRHRSSSKAGPSRRLKRGGSKESGFDDESFVAERSTNLDGTQSSVRSISEESRRNMRSSMSKENLHKLVGLRSSSKALRQGTSEALDYHDEFQDVDYRSEFSPPDVPPKRSTRRLTSLLRPSPQNPPDFSLKRSTGQSSSRRRKRISPSKQGLTSYSRQTRDKKSQEPPRYGNYNTACVSWADGFCTVLGMEMDKFLNDVGRLSEKLVFSCCRQLDGGDDDSSLDDSETTTSSETLYEDAEVHYEDKPHPYAESVKYLRDRNTYTLHSRSTT